MAEKDIAQKTLESYNDVFADIVNGLLFGGKEVVKEDELENDVTNSFYKADGKLHEQERDVSKFWKNCNFRVALIGLENQTAIDKAMPLRVMGYDGASYRQQLLNKEQKSYYPVITIVLYFGKQRWNKNRTLYECIDVPEELKPYVNDYKVNVFEIAHLTDEQVNMFKGDFKLVADYFVHTKESKEYEPMPGEIKHLWEILCLMQALTGDNRFEEMYSDLKEKESVSMCEVVDNFINKGVSKGVRQEKIRFIMKLHKKNIANSEIADYAELTEEEVEKILKENNLA